MYSKIQFSPEKKSLAEKGLTEFPEFCGSQLDSRDAEMVTMGATGGNSVSPRVTN
jgi:hypothetical protein